ncbi:MAG: hypothetical protein A3F31_03280 [Candidatus Levybacteria bacterium RIFCSPHIGHO2_12_FULL_38_12]|nr:MAG: hypothetical protein A2770_03705 [Candidatus Levybacteria bacterium RIFCSPHIGHO2_01_FULL_38_12]OGH22123.1 MAG: hypothetical protein A3D75_02650 [Candidatus Levybacteria bacterium RIFCSPHIGHO2_02_FULL_37_18]OGH22971.1 MAG: hypothetical protein A3F31_03280 [Candidatus Levybacteria bacterium RIFCSPHIGHO2_12_FULL_38_12]OGH34141.1 MAG: hypothetical protein A3A47_03410 [Candidatus Levybacteria bacterium RIFCSPLOWO2_01_FULL_37_20]OGH44934.1 MAG: hypothetical protein A3J14_01075 [Candidatus Lev
MRSKEALIAVPVAERPAQFLLPFIPGPEGRRKHISERLVHTAGHELNHALVAMDNGVTVAGITVVRRGNVLGSTSVVGDVFSDTFRAIAAGGSIATHDGNAFGYGSDIQEVLGHPQGRSSTTDILERAKSAITKYSVEVRRKAAEMIAYLKNVTGSMLPLILQRADLEVTLEAYGIMEPVIAQVATFEPVEFEDGEITIIETHENGKIVIKAKGEAKKFCVFCLGIGEHRLDCSNRNEGFYNEVDCDSFG